MRLCVMMRHVTIVYKQCEIPICEMNSVWE